MGCYVKKTGAQIECFDESQLDMLEFIEQNMRGGISIISHRHAIANNKYMKNFDKNQKSSFIMYLDANNLYGWAMSQLLPIGKYRWANPEDFDLKKIMNLSEKSKKGYIFEVDINIPKEKHDYFNSYPPCPESTYGYYSKHTQDIMDLYDINQGSQVKKLIPNLNNKTKYVTHYRNLQLYLSLGCELVKIHRVLEFEQSDYLKEYIDFNTDKRS
jgi:hypothetical protein